MAKKKSIIKRIESKVPKHLRWPMWLLLWLIGVVLGVLLMDQLWHHEPQITQFFGGDDDVYFALESAVGAILSLFFLITGFILFFPAFVWLWAMLFGILPGGKKLLAKIDKANKEWDKHYK